MPWHIDFSGTNAAAGAAVSAITTVGLNAMETTQLASAKTLMIAQLADLPNGTVHVRADGHRSLNSSSMRLQLDREPQDSYHQNVGSLGRNANTVNTNTPYLP